MKKNILITGGTGTFGKSFIKLVSQQKDVNKIFVFSRDEMKQWNMKIQFNNFSKKINYIIGDIRDFSKVNSTIRDNKIDYIVHAAATKIVLSAEYNPDECVKTNILGAMNVIDAAKANNVKKVIALSTDKASNPINLYGATKLASDKLFISANLNKSSKTIFSVVRYGNVMGSRGSVIPYFISLNKNKNFPITDKRMTRFMIPTEDAVKFVLTAIKVSVGGEIFVKKSPSMKITDIAKAINSNIPILFKGIRAGEKLHEQMIGSEESQYTYEFKDYYIIISPILNRSKYKKILKYSKKVDRTFEYTSDKNTVWLSQKEFKIWLSKYIKNQKLLS